MRKIYRSRVNKKICGVCGGIAEYFDTDPTIIRIIWIFASLALGSGLLAYIICAFVMPDKPKDSVKEAKVINEKKDKKN